MSDTTPLPKEPQQADCPSAPCSRLDTFANWLSLESWDDQCQKLAAGNKWAKRAYHRGRSEAFLEALDELREVFDAHSLDPELEIERMHKCLQFIRPLIVSLADMSTAPAWMQARSMAAMAAMDKIMVEADISYPHHDFYSANASVMARPDGGPNT